MGSLPVGEAAWTSKEIFELWLESEIKKTQIHMECITLWDIMTDITRQIERMGHGGKPISWSEIRK